MYIVPHICEEVTYMSPVVPGENNWGNHNHGCHNTGPETTREYKYFMKLVWLKTRGPWLALGCSPQSHWPSYPAKYNHFNYIANGLPKE